jgi:amino-acid N-acetyltransferase
LRRSVRRFLTTLPEAYRQPLELAEFEGLSIAAIATRLHLSETAVKSRLARGRAQLRQKLLDCCQFEFDTFGKVIDLRQRNACACDATPTVGPAAERRAHSLPPHLSVALAVDEDEPAIRALLESAGLPVTDLTAGHILNFVTAKTGDQVVGCAGIEVHETAGLLRSVAVAAGLRGLGVGGRLVEVAETLAAQLRLRELFLLTTTAPVFFERRGYGRIERGAAPPAIRASREFAALCPASAIVMRKDLREQPVRAGCC